MSEIIKLSKVMSNEAYHAKKEYLSSSTIKTLLKNPHEFLNPISKSSSAYAVGSATHSLILEPNKFEKEFAVAPIVDKRTKIGKEIFAEFEASSEGKTVLSAEDYELAKKLSESVLSLDETKRLMRDGDAELSFFSKINNIKVKCRPDYYRQDLGLIIDIKTVQDASPDSFIKDVANYEYYIQASLYMNVLRSLGLPANDFLFIVVEKKEPYMVGFYRLDYTSLEFGTTEYLRAFDIFKDIDSYKTNIYRDTKDKSVVQTLTLPNYVYYKKGA